MATTPDGRTVPPLHADERTTLGAWLDFHRDTLALKCEGLDEAQARLASVPPSAMTMLGLVRHVTRVERTWFHGVFGGMDVSVEEVKAQDGGFALESSSEAKGDGDADGDGDGDAGGDGDGEADGDGDGDADGDGEADGASGSLAAALSQWRAATALSRSLVADAALDDSGTFSREDGELAGGDTVSLRWILIHMIEEYARHNGHADLLREVIDGTTGP
ncbi:DinB family protein [Streptomyces sp. NPDC048442]|uniref:DinB family protein n=1 Tax=Streptomyces sp. NPDC048442 TaxID=3154823 RepID=UPI00343D2FEC